jgi:hypothetical protein
MISIACAAVLGAVLLAAVNRTTLRRSTLEYPQSTPRVPPEYPQSTPEYCLQP